MFKFLTIILVSFLALGQAQDLEDSVKGILIKTISAAASRQLPLDQTCDGIRSGSVCGTDCATLLTCRVGSVDPLAQFYCSTVTPSNPYCNLGATGCSAAPIDSTDPTCRARSDFVCTDVGYFPDPKNCSLYNYCTDVLDAEVYQCPPGYIYNSPLERCTRRTHAIQCVTINCNNQLSYPAYLPYRNHRAFYAVCTLVNGVVSTAMFRCQDTVNSEFNPTTLSCEFKCRADGLYADVTDIGCTRYYECYRRGFTYLSNLKTCPTGTLFDTVRNNCVLAATANNSCTVV